MTIETYKVFYASDPLRERKGVRSLKCSNLGPSPLPIFAAGLHQL